MEREDLEMMLSEGLSLEAIGRRVGRHPSTVAYWLGKYRLQAVNRDKHVARGGPDRQHLTELVEAGYSIREIAADVGVSPTTARHWLGRHGLKTCGGRGRIEREQALPDENGLYDLSCAHHGPAKFAVDARGYARCVKCRADAVVRRRRKVKAILVAEAGGTCVICGYQSHLGALQFHHLDPSSKLFGLANRGFGRSLASLREEASKCVLLCSNCHAEVEGGVGFLPK